MKEKISIMGGCGHVGLPLAVTLAKKNYKVFAIDKDKKKINLLNKKKTPFLEIGLEEALNNLKKKNINFSNELSIIKDTRVVIITLGTPINKYFKPDFKFFISNFNKIIPYLSNDHTIILRSTVLPGTTKKILINLKNIYPNIGLAYCPERISQGNAIKELRILPQIISASDIGTINICKKIFNKLGVKIITLSFEEAEVAKLFCNAWRYIKFSTANQFYKICSEKNLNFSKIRNAMTFNYDRAIDFPHSGFAAGPCLFKDTLQLLAYDNKNFSIGKIALKINDKFPDFLIKNFKKKFSLIGKKVGILGMTFKPDSDDLRDSLAFKLKKILLKQKCKVFCADNFIKNKNFKSSKYIIKNCNPIFVGSPHSVYKNLKFKKGTNVINCWSSFKVKI
jgi:UDP-N-acetyl-D-mannosaminuronic acid dehydrogenase